MIRFPAEWEPQSAVVIAWPHASGDFANLSAVEDSYHSIAITISRFQPLVIICKDGEHQEHIQSLLKNTSNTHFGFWPCPGGTGIAHLQQFERQNTELPLSQ